MRIQIQIKGSVLDAIAAATTYLPEGIAIVGIGEMGFDTIALNLEVPAGTEEIWNALERWYVSADGECPPGGYPEWTLIHYEGGAYSN